MDSNPVRRVLFPASTPLSFVVVAPLVHALASDPRIKLAFTARHGGRALARQLVKVPFQYVPGPLAKWQRFDLAICSGFFFRSRRSREMVEMFHGVSPKNYAIRAEVDRFDRLFLIGEYHRRKFVRAGLLEEDDPRGLKVGMPKTDRLLNPGGEGALLLESLQLDPGLPTVVYAPTRSGSSGSSLDSSGLELIDRIREMPVNLLVKLHDRSLPRYRKSMKVDFAALILARQQGSRVRLVCDPDVVPALLAADVLISDLSSVSSEFLLRDRPVVLLSVPHHEEKIRASSLKKFGADDPENLDYLRQAGEVVEMPESIPAALERALSDPAARSAERRARAKLLFYNPGRATAVATEATYRCLELSPP